MKLAFLDYLKKKLSPTEEPASPAARSTTVAKPESDRLSKTVLPNATRTVPPQDPFHTAAAVSGPAALSAPKSAPRAVSFTPSSTRPTISSHNLPPAVAVALEPNVERAVALQLSDVVAYVPEGYLKPSASYDGNRRILLKAAEIEKGMACGAPAVPLGNIYEQVPEIFMRSVPLTDSTNVRLPMEKVMDALSRLAVRQDQEAEHSVPQVDTPFLQATLEDNKRFGIVEEPPRIHEMPPVRLEIEPATAEAVAAAHPEATAAEKFIPSPVARQSASPGEGNGAPVRIPFKLPPDGTGESAPQRVPASSGPPVPTVVEPAASPVRIPFKISPPSADVRKGTTADAPMASKEDEVMVGLGLLPILQSLPAFQLAGNPNSISEDARVELPLSLIKSQLATGRVAVSPAVFQKAMPEKYRDIFNASDAHTPVVLPLQEILRHLPASSLTMRDDQETVEAGEHFETPFSTAAAEDAQRLKSPDAGEGQSTQPAAPASKKKAASKGKTKGKAAPVAAPEVPVAAEMPEVPVVAEIPVVPEVVEARPEQPVQEDKNRAKEIVTEASALAGISSCVVTFTDGLALAGNLPPEIHAEGLCAVAPSLLHKLEKHMQETNLGQLEAITVHCDATRISFFTRGTICLAVLHAAALPAEIRAELGRMTDTLSAAYAQT